MLKWLLISRESGPTVVFIYVTVNSSCFWSKVMKSLQSTNMKHELIYWVIFLVHLSCACRTILSVFIMYQKNECAVRLTDCTRKTFFFWGGGVDKSCFWYLLSTVVGAEKLAIEDNFVLPLSSQDSPAFFKPQLWHFERRLKAFDNGCRILVR